MNISKNHIHTMCDKIVMIVDLMTGTKANYKKRHVVTRCDEIISRINKDSDVSIQYADVDEECVSVYDLLACDVITIKISDIEELEYTCVDECLKTNPVQLTNLTNVPGLEDETVKSDIKIPLPLELYTPIEIVEHDIDIDYEKYAKMIRSVIEYTRQHTQDGLYSHVTIHREILNTLNMTRNQYLEHVADPIKHPVENITEIQNWWMDKIREYRLKALELLDVEENAAKDEGDTDTVDEIDLVKQMLRDIPQDIDLSNYTKLEELLLYWPPLLLPRPKPREIFNYTITNNQNKPLVNWGAFGDMDDEYYKSDEYNFDK